MINISRRALVAGAAASIAAPSLLRAQTQPRPVRFAMDWVWQGNHSIWTYAEETGIFAKEGIKPELTRGYGSADNLAKLGGGALDLALVDPNLLTKFNHENPTAPSVATLIVYDAAPSSIIFLKSSGIRTLKDLEGRSLAITEADAAWPLFQVLCKINNVDISKINIQSMSPQLRDSMVVLKRVDASLGFYMTAILNIAASGVPRDDIGYIQFNKSGLELFSLSVVCQKSFAERNPDLVRGFVKATVEGTKAMLANRKAAIASIIKRDPLTNPEIEYERNELFIDGSLLTPWVKENGMSVVDPKRLEYTTGLVAEALGIPTKPKVQDLYNDLFLPPQADRRLV